MSDPRYLTPDERRSLYQTPGVIHHVKALEESHAAADEMLDKERRLRAGLRNVLRCHNIPDEPAPCGTCTCDACLEARWVDDETGGDA